MPSWSVLRKPTPDQTQLRVQRDQQTGIPGQVMSLTTAPTWEELETWAIQIGFTPTDYIQARERQAQKSSMAFDPTQPVPPPIEQAQPYDGLTPPPPPPLPAPPFDPHMLPSFRGRNRVHWTTVIALGFSFGILLIPVVLAILGYQ